MKKVLSIALVAGMFAIYSCGPSAEEKAAAEKQKQDSVAAAEQAAQAAAQAQASIDSTAKMAADTTKK